MIAGIVCYVYIARYCFFLLVELYSYFVCLFIYFIATVFGE